MRPSVRTRGRDIAPRPDDGLAHARPALHLRRGCRRVAARLPMLGATLSPSRPGRCPARARRRSCTATGRRRAPRPAPRRRCRSAGRFAARPHEDRVGGVGDDLRAARALHRLVAAEEVLDGGRGDHRARPSALTAMPSSRNSSAIPHAHAHAVLGDRVAEVVAEPLGVHVERRRQREDVRVVGLLQVRDARLGDEEGPRVLMSCIRS